jgi:hypothetical protein
MNDISSALLSVLRDSSALLSVLRDWAPDAMGALGLLLYLGSYLALQLGLIRGDDCVFPTFILAAALSMILSLTARFNPFSMMVEVAWAAISVIGLIRALHHLQVFSLQRRGAGSSQAAYARTRKGPCPQTTFAW